MQDVNASFNALINQIEEGWEGLVGGFLQVLFKSLWSEEIVYAAGIGRWLCTALPLALTLTNVKLLFFHGSGGMSLVGLAQAPSSALAALTSDCQSPKLAMIAACLSTSACCHPTPVLVGCFRNAWRAESLLSAGEWGYCIFRYFLKPWGDNSSWETELQGARCVSILYLAETQPALADRSWASWASCLRGWRWGCTTRHCAGSYSCWSSAIWEWGSACITCHNNTSAHAKWVPLSSP